VNIAFVFPEEMLSALDKRPALKRYPEAQLQPDGAGVAISHVWVLVLIGHILPQALAR
jgi:hypothetical protein